MKERGIDPNEVKKKEKEAPKVLAGVGLGVWSSMKSTSEHKE